MRTRRVFVCLLLGGLLLGGCGGTEPGTQVEALETIELPDPVLDGPKSLEAAMIQRRSTREFTDESPTIEELSQLMWAAQGITRAGGRRTAPSAGALYPLEVYVATDAGLYHYLPDGHQAEIVSRDDHREGLFWAAYRQEAIRDAPVTFVICGVYSRTEAKYGDRAVRYVHLEAGHAAQNLLLQAVAQDLGGVPIGAFLDGQVQRVLDLPSDVEPLYLIPIGHPERG